MRLSQFNYNWRNQFFVTICTKNRNYIFGNIKDKKMGLSSFGLMTKKCLQEIPEHFPEVTIDEFVIMPDHIHLILCFETSDNQIPVPVRDRHACHQTSPQHQKISVIIGSFKSAVTKQIRRNEPDIRQIWQRSFHDRLIRSDNDMERIRTYIKDNPKNYN